MKNKSNIIIILAAGKGTRINSQLPKVLHLLKNKSLLSYVINTSKELSPLKIIVVVGYKKELIIEQFQDDDIVFVEQKKLRGTAVGDRMPQGGGFWDDTDINLIEAWIDEGALYH